MTYILVLIILSPPQSNFLQTDRFKALNHSLGGPEDLLAIRTL